MWQLTRRDQVFFRRFFRSCKRSSSGICAARDFGIGVDPKDGLLRQGAEGYQLTWMDAKVDDWVVTPRRGKAVEINALWYNALCYMKQWLEEEGRPRKPAKWRQHARRCRDSFQEAFLVRRRRISVDVVDGEDGDDRRCDQTRCSRFRCLSGSGERQVGRGDGMRRTNLLTPVGLRTLAPGKRTTKQNTMAIFARAMRRTIREQCGHG